MGDEDNATALRTAIAKAFAKLCHGDGYGNIEPRRPLDELGVAKFAWWSARAPRRKHGGAE
jgi:hypothetical protein